MVALPGSTGATPFNVVIRGAMVPLGPQAFALAITGPGVALASPGSCGGVPVTNAINVPGQPIAYETPTIVLFANDVKPLIITITVLALVVCVLLTAVYKLVQRLWGNRLGAGVKRAISVGSATSYSNMEGPATTSAGARVNAPVASWPGSHPADAHAQSATVVHIAERGGDSTFTFASEGSTVAWGATSTALGGADTTSRPAEVGAHMQHAGAAGGGGEVKAADSSTSAGVPM